MQNTKQGSLFTLSAPSGGGKSSLIKALLEKYTDNSVQLSVSHTTRQPRPGETDGVHYHFVDKETFLKMVDNNEFFEWAEVFGNYYGTSQKAVNVSLDQGIDILLDIDWQGARQVKDKQADAIGVFILPPSKEELDSRLRNRGQDSEDVINGRMEQAVSEMSHYNEADYLIFNDDFQQALADFETILLSARLQQAKQAKKHAKTLNDLLA